MDNPKRSPSTPWLVGLALAIVAVTVVVVVYREPLWEFFEHHRRVRDWVTRFGSWAPLMMIALSALQVVVAPIPGQFVGLVNGYLFGTALGTLYGMIGLVLGTAVAIGIGYLGRPWIERFISSERLDRWDAVAKQWGPPAFFLAFLLPGLPDDLLCFLIGLCRLPFFPMLLLAAIGRFPGLLAAAYLGANAHAFPTWAWAIAGILAVVVALLLMWKSDRLEATSLALAQTFGRGRSRE